MKKFDRELICSDFGQGLKEFEWKVLETAIETRFFRGLNAYTAESGYAQELRAILQKFELFWCRNERVWMENSRKGSNQNFDVPCQDLIELVPY